MIKNHRAVSASWLTKTAVEVVETLPAAVRETLLQTKQEQTFSSLIASKMNSDFSNGGQMIALVEIRGKSLNSKQRNTHDIALLDENGRKICIVENKLWYHFDGAKGRRKPKVEKEVVEQLDNDVKKIQLTLKDQREPLASGFVLLHLVTPQEKSKLPYSYKQSLETALYREKGSTYLLMESGLNGFMGVLDGFKDSINAVSHSSREFPGSSSRLDVICAQVRSNS
jgi:hypothetical protein